MRTIGVATAVLALTLGSVGARHAVGGPPTVPSGPGQGVGEPAGVAPTGVGNTDHLDAGLRHAVDRAIAAATADGVDLRVTSGWRSARQQQQLFDAAVATYGSAERAHHWVLPPAESAHVRGLAVDVGPSAGARWLERHGVHFGLCRRYGNESWHFERLAPARGARCPALQAHA